MPGGSEAYYSFNLYDIFANFLPGAILLLGLFLPSLGIEDIFIDLSLGSTFVFLILSFAAGLVIQACGHWIHSGAEQFDKHLSKFDEDDSVVAEGIEDTEEGANEDTEDTEEGANEDIEDTEENADEDAENAKNTIDDRADREDSNNHDPAEELTESEDEMPDPDESESTEEVESIDAYFIELIRDERNYSARYNNWTSLYRWVLVKLDDSSRTRAIRLHGLFLATRGMFVASVILFAFYALTFYLYQDEIITIEISEVLCASLAGVSFLLAVIFYLRAADLNQSLTDTMIKEYVAEFDS